MKRKTCFMIGHRDTEETVYPALQRAVRQHIAEYGVNEFIVGRYGRFDRLAAHAVRCVKEEYPQVILTLLQPYYAEKTFIDPDRSVRSRLVSGSNGTCTIPLCDCTCEPLRSGTRRSFDCLCTPHTQSSRSVAGLCQKKRGAGQDDRFFVD